MSKFIRLEEILYNNEKDKLAFEKIIVNLSFIKEIIIEDNSIIVGDSFGNSYIELSEESMEKLIEALKDEGLML